MKKRIIAVNSNCYHGYSIEEAIAGIRRAGFHYIELTATKGWTEHVFPDMPFERLLAIQDELEAAQIRPFAMSGHCNLMDPERIPDFVKNIRLAAFFGCDYIVSSIGEAHLKDNAVADNPTVAESIRTLVPHLERYGLTLVWKRTGMTMARARCCPTSCGSSGPTGSKSTTTPPTSSSTAGWTPWPTCAPA